MIKWSEEKAARLKMERNIDITRIAKLIDEGQIAEIEKVKIRQGIPIS